MAIAGPASKACRVADQLLGSLVKAEGDDSRRHKGRGELVDDLLPCVFEGGRQPGDDPLDLLSRQMALLLPDFFVLIIPEGGEPAGVDEVCDDLDFGFRQRRLSLEIRPCRHDRLRKLRVGQPDLVRGGSETTRVLELPRGGQVSEVDPTCANGFEGLSCRSALGSMAEGPREDSMQASNSSATAEYMALFRAQESALPVGTRLFHDPFAASFLSPRFRAAAALFRIPIVRSLLKHWMAHAGRAFARRRSRAPG